MEVMGRDPIPYAMQRQESERRMSRRRSRADARAAKEAKEAPTKPQRAVHPGALPVEVQSRALSSAVVLMPVVLIAAALAAYHNSFSGVFILDDKIRIVSNTQIRELWPPWLAMAGSSRPIVQLSLAFNYALGGLNAW